ncbi:BpmI endonuclease-methyltransferase fusion protein type IIG [Candidatus Paraburkholderia calva]|nr:BpmI endonuclease-methyltransferase fusion protein type IIG [Candidatus Paraburkholderia calva]
MEVRPETRMGLLAFHHLYWPRDEAFFAAGEKILAPRKCVSPVFLHTEDEAYVMLSVNVIRTARIDMRFLSAVLNSSVVRYWLRHRGNMQGANFQIDAAPLRQIPIASATPKQRDVIARLVRIVQQRYGLASAEALSLYEALIDACVMECYFGEHMSARGLSFSDATAHLDASNEPDVEIAQRLHGLSDVSPELLAIIRSGR